MNTKWLMYNVLFTLRQVTYKTVRRTITDGTNFRISLARYQFMYAQLHREPDLCGKKTATTPPSCHKLLTSNYLLQIVKTTIHSLPGRAYLQDKSLSDKARCHSRCAGACARLGGWRATDTDSGVT